MQKPVSAPVVGVSKPRNDFGPQHLLGALDILSRRQQARAARLSSISRLRGGA